MPSASVLNRNVDSKVNDVIHSKSVLISETATGTSFSASIVIPAGSILLDVIVVPIALWTAGTSASLEVGDETDPNGWFEATNLKATDLILGERFMASSDNFWGGKNGVYLTTAGRFGVATGNGVGGYFETAGAVTALVTRSGSTGAAGRTMLTAVWTPLYSVGANT